MMVDHLMSVWIITVRQLRSIKLSQRIPCRLRIKAPKGNVGKRSEFALKMPPPCGVEFHGSRYKRVVLKKS